MTSLLAFLFALSLTAVVAAFDSQTGQLPPPTGLNRTWLDAITVQISWEKPHEPPANVVIYYKVEIANKMWKIEKPGNITVNLFTREMDSDHWKFQVWTSSDNSSWRPSSPATLNISHDKQTAELVKDFKCVMGVNKLNCSWIPANPSLNLTVKYRMCGIGEETRNNVKTCGKPSSTGDPERHGCILQRDKAVDDTCIFVETDSAVTTFKPQLVINPPLVNITEENNTLTVTLTPPLPDKVHCMTFDVCYKRCNVHQECRTTASGVSTMNIQYDKTCRYEFQAKTKFLESCIQPALVSEMSDPVTYGVNEPTDMRLAIAAIFISIILSVCIILLCYCFRKHRDIFWPDIPDPSVLLKQMMTGNNDFRTPGGNLYTPVPEPICPLQIYKQPQNYIIENTS